MENRNLKLEHFLKRRQRGLKSRRSWSRAGCLDEKKCEDVVMKLVSVHSSCTISPRWRSDLGAHNPRSSSDTHCTVPQQESTLCCDIRWVGSYFKIKLKVKKKKKSQCELYCGANCGNKSEGWSAPFVIFCWQPEPNHAEATFARKKMIKKQKNPSCKNNKQVCHFSTAAEDPVWI